jgi:RHS repeat-associated protein
MRVTYTYDVEGKRVQQDKWKQSTGRTATTRFVYDGDNVAVDLDGSNNVLVRYLYGDGLDQLLTRTVASGANAGRWAYLTDNLGSVRDLGNWNGQVQDHLNYTGFGVPTDYFPAVSDRYQYAAGEYDADTGLVHVGRRYYFPTIGRWGAEDPWKFRAGDPDLYRYVGNNPTNRTDPSGLVAGETRSGLEQGVKGIFGWSITVPDRVGKKVWADFRLYPSPDNTTHHSRKDSPGTREWLVLQRCGALRRVRKLHA